MKSTIEGRFPSPRSAVWILPGSSIGACGRTDWRRGGVPGHRGPPSLSWTSLPLHRGLRGRARGQPRPAWPRPCPAGGLRGRARVQPGPRLCPGTAAARAPRRSGPRRRRVTFHVKHIGRDGESRVPVPPFPRPEVPRDPHHLDGRAPRPEAAEPTSSRDRVTSRACRSREATHSGIWPAIRPWSRQLERAIGTSHGTGSGPLPRFGGRRYTRHCRPRGHAGMVRRPRAN